MFSSVHFIAPSARRVRMSDPSRCGLRSAAVEDCTCKLGHNLLAMTLNFAGLYIYKMCYRFSECFDFYILTSVTLKTRST